MFLGTPKFIFIIYYIYYNSVGNNLRLNFSVDYSADVFLAIFIHQCGWSIHSSSISGVALIRSQFGAPFLVEFVLVSCEPSEFILKLST